MRAWIAAAALAAIVGTGAARAEPGAGPGFRIGPWEAAPVGAGSGLPVICGAAMHQGGNEALGLVVDLMGRMWFMATSPRWNVAPGRPVGALVSFDNGPRESMLARVSDPRELRFDVPAASPLEASLRRAGRVAIYAAGQVVQFRLEQVSEVIDRLRRCTAEGSAAAADGAKANTAPAGAAVPSDGAAPRALARAAAPLPVPTTAWPNVQRESAPRPTAVGEDAPRRSLQALYAALSPSVWLVKVARGSATTWSAIGSAVAVTHDTLLTNCHVVSGARRIELTRGETALAATILSGDPRSDRCLLRTTDARLTPVPGVREVASLTVGERVYTIGNPSGLEATFGEGIISGLRRAGGIQLVQTTAPASPGSSGGGLFDARGNLVGITSFAISAPRNMDVFRFAIAAEEYWR